MAQKRNLSRVEKIPPNLLPDKDDMTRIKQISKELDKNAEKMKLVFKSTIKLYFDLGSIILPWSMHYRGKLSAQIMEDIFKISMRKINLGLKIYKHFNDNPALMEGLSVYEALKMIDFRERSEKKERVILTYHEENGQQEFSWEDFFDIPPVAKVKLEKFRLTCPNNHELYLIEKGQNYPIKIVDLYTGQPESSTLKLAHQEMVKNVQASIEKYYAQYEKEVTT